MTSRERTDSQTNAVFVDPTTRRDEHEKAELRREVEALKLKLAQAEEQQSATREILRGISSSPADLQRLLHAVAERAAYLCDANDAVIVRVDGDVFRLAAHYGTLTTITSEEPIPIQRDLASGRAIIDRRVVHVPDVLTEPDSEFAGAKAYAARFGYRTNLAVPMLRNGIAIGAMVIRRVEVRPFSDDQIELLKTFADQAVIALENTRLLTELQDRLEQQTFTNEILSVISQSQRDVGPVFEAIAANARNLCNASTGLVYTFDGELIHIAAVNSVSRGAVEAVHRTFPMPPGRGGAVARSILTGAVVYVRDVQGDPEYGLQDLIQAFGLRSIVSVPMLRDGKPIGAICVTGVEPAMFTQRQVALLQTFADQAVIAIENTRLFDELQERLTATSDILRVISQSQRDVQPVFEAIAASARKLCRSTSGWVHTFDDNLINVAAVEGLRPEGLEVARRMYPMPPNRGSAPGRAILSRAVCYIPDIRKDSEYRLQAFAQEAGFLCALSVPMVREGRPIGTVTVAGAEPAMFTERQIAMLQTFADQAVIAIENTRLFNETQEALHKVEERTTELTEALEHQTAISQVLRVLSESPTDVTPVLQVILDSATRLLEPQLASILRYDGRLIHVAANRNWTPEMTKEASALFPMPADERSIAGRAILARKTIAVEDLLSDPQYALAQIGKAGRRTISAPMVKGGVPLGAITVAWSEPGKTPQRQIDLLNTFADQAVIAIENTRLFNELQTRTEELARSIERLRSLSEVSQAVNSTLDIEQVLNTIVVRAVQLSSSDAGLVYELDQDGHLQPRASHGLPSELATELFGRPLTLAESVVGRAAAARATVQIPDVLIDNEFEGRARETIDRAGFRAVLAVPLLSEGQLVGGLAVSRKTPGSFAPEVLDVLQTFASQSTLAIQNARLFREIEQKSRELEAASRHKSEFLANMSHELRTPLNAVIGFSEVLGEQMFGELNEKQVEHVQDIHVSGQHLLSLINDILDLSKIEAGHMELSFGEFDVPTAIENALTLVKERAARHGVKLEVEVGHSLGSFYADERRFKQILLNLLSNAVKFTPEGGKVSLCAEQVKDELLVSVIDSGIGIAEDDQGLIFEEFRQVKTKDQSKPEGTGLGLALTKRFVEMQGGRIWVHSQVGKGSTFAFTLPCNLMPNRG
jgi:GAF domain-containing protein